MGVEIGLASWEILRALALGIQFCEFAEGWRAVGPWQDPSWSAIDGRMMDDLLNAGYIERQMLGIGSYAAVTESGHAALTEKSNRDFEAAFEWLNSNASRFES
jgi:hypothetical protein